MDSGRIEVVTCETQLRELADVLNRSRIRNYTLPNKRKSFSTCFAK